MKEKNAAMDHFPIAFTLHSASARQLAMMYRAMRGKEGLNQGPTRQLRALRLAAIAECRSDLPD